jgi:acetyl-CoA acyltransferase
MIADSYIFDSIRTPIGRFRGTLSTVRTDDLAAIVIRELMNRNSSVDPEAIDDVILGCANQAGEDNRNVARMASLLAGLPVSVPGETVNRLCASGMSAVIHARRAIAAGEGHLFITGGVEHMTRGPWVISKTSKPFGNDAEMYDSSFGWRFINPKIEEVYGADGMGHTAENLVDRYQISRGDQDKFASWSQQKAAKARGSGRLAEEIIPVEIPHKKNDPVFFKEDEFIRPDTSPEILAKLKPAFRNDGTVTAGNSSGLNDGAGASLIGSESAARKFNMEPRARIAASAVIGVEPRIMGIGPVYASRIALDRAGLSLDDMDIIEINEAFAAQVLACTRQLNLEDTDERINPNGGAIALGHPLGMSGMRLIQTASIELHKQQKRYALATMCVGVGQGYAVILEKV